MIFDLIDYIVGMLKMLGYKIVYGRRFVFCLKSKFSRQFQLRIFNHGSVKIGDNMVIRAGAKIRVNGNGKVVIGKNSGLNNYCLINCMDEIKIGDNVIFGQNVMLYDHDHEFKNSGLIRDHGFVTEKIVIEDNVWIGSNCIILKGSHIGRNSVIAAGTTVRGTIPENTMVYNKKELCLKPIERD